MILFVKVLSATEHIVLNFEVTQHDRIDCSRSNSASDVCRNSKDQPGELACVDSLDAALDPVASLSWASRARTYHLVSAHRLEQTQVRHALILSISIVSTLSLLMRFLQCVKLDRSIVYSIFK